MRKTVDRDVIVSVINTHLKTGSNSNKQERVALILAFEDIMFKAGTYKGFRYLGTSDMTGDVEGMWPGIRGARCIWPPATALRVDISADRKSTRLNSSH